MKKSILLLLIFVLAFSMISCGKNIKGEILVKEVVKTDAGNFEIFRYTPDNFEFHGTDTPIIYILSDEKDEDGIRKILDLGFKDIASKEKCSIIFILKGGDSWEESDITRVTSLLGNSSEQYLPGMSYRSGVTKKGLFLGSHFRKYIFLTGSAIDFSNTYLNEGEFYITEWGVTVDKLCAGLVTFETKEDVLNGFEEIKYTTITYLDDKNTYLSTFSYYEEEGIDVSKLELLGKVNATLYEPAGLLKDSPLVIVFHGRGSHPDTVVRELDIAISGKENGYNILSIEGPYNMFYGKNVSSKLTKKTYKAIEKFIDSEGIGWDNIYLVGFSQGAYRAMALGTNYPDKFKKVAICELVNSKGIKIKEEIPTLMICGENDFYNVLPSQNNWGGSFVKSIYDVNKEKVGELKDTIYSDVWNVPVEFFLAFSTQNYRVNVDKALDNLFLCSIEGLSHNVFPEEMDLIWDFFSGRIEE